MNVGRIVFGSNSEGYCKKCRLPLTILGYCYACTIQSSDEEQLHKDWEAVGLDMWNAYKQSQNEQYGDDNDHASVKSEDDS